MTRKTRFLLRLIVVLSMVLSTGTLARGDEGMWLFNNPPRKLLKEKYGFDATDSWLDHLMHAAVRFNSGGSGSFVSADGLIITNHHVGADALQKLSTAQRDLVATGFLAKTREQEIKAVDLELNVLMDIQDVTARVQAAVKPGIGPAEAQVARRAVMNTIEQEAFKKTGLRSDVVTLYQGGQYQLYQFKKYTDVRLVFAPEKDIAFFGGDPDNFEYPRYDLDICLFRAYENGQPAKVRHWLQWSPAGAKDDELVFVTGHPGRTERLDTVAHLEFIRDRLFPDQLDRLFRREVILRAYSERSLENARRAQEALFGIQNSRKARLGGLAGLQDPAIMKAKQQAEDELRSRAGGDTKPWDDVAGAIKVEGGIYTDLQLLEYGQAFNSRLFNIARTLVRLAEESAKPNADRLREYRESNLDSLRQQLFSTAPIYNDFETTKLADSLSMYLEQKGPGDALVQKVMTGESPQDRAAQLVLKTKLADVAVRKSLADGGLIAIKSSDDPMIALARLVDEPARAVRKIDEQQVDEPMRQAYAKIAELRFKLFGTDVYPDATFTLRLAFGTVKGYEEQGKQIPPWTTIGGAYQHAAEHGNVPPFKLPERWTERKSQLDLNTPFNFVSTADIIGGNSGSPVVNRQGQFVGIIFDGNIQSLVLDFVYTDRQARAVSVHSSAIIEALRKVYDAQALADELQPQKPEGR